MRELTEEEMERAAKALAEWDVDCGVDPWTTYPEHLFPLPSGRSIADLNQAQEGEQAYYRRGVEAVLAALPRGNTHLEAL